MLFELLFCLNRKELKLPLMVKRSLGVAVFSPMRPVMVLALSTTVVAAAFWIWKAVAESAIGISDMPANNGVAALWIFWIVLTTPDATVKLVELNWAMPFTVVLALLIVTVPPLAVLSATVNAPLNPFRDVTQLENAGAEEVDIRHKPELPAVTAVSAPDPCPIMTPLAVSELAPVPP